MIYGLQPISLKHIGHILQEVMSEEKRDAHQKCQVDGTLAESVVEAGALHVELLCEPGDGTALLLQFCVNALAYAQVVHGQFQPLGSA